MGEQTHGESERQVAERLRVPRQPHFMVTSTLLVPLLLFILFIVKYDVSSPEEQKHVGKGSSLLMLRCLGPPDGGLRWHRAKPVLVRLL